MPGPINETKRKLHWASRDYNFFAGVNANGGEVLNAPYKEGGKIVKTGYQKDRSTYPDDVLATLDSARGSVRNPLAE